MKTSRDKTFDRAIKFANNFQDVHPGISNLYVFTLVDEDGNIVDEKYGMNLMTNAGFAAIYRDGNTFRASETVGLYVGQGGNDITVSDTPALQAPAFGGLRATNSDTEVYYNYPMYFSKAETSGQGLITLISKFLTCYYDYNVPNYPEDTYLSEYGIGTGTSSLWTHSHIYDATGQRASITKYNNTRLYVNVYMCLSFYESLIQNGWANNKFIAITKNAIMYSRMLQNKIYTYKRDGANADRTGTPTVAIDTTNPAAYVNSITLPEFVLSSGGGADSGYFAGFVFKQDGFAMIDPETISTPENFSVEGLVSKTPWSYDGFSQGFGMTTGEYSVTKHLPLTHIIQARANLFDVNTGTWSNTLDIFNSSNKYYDEIGSSMNFCQPLYYYSSSGNVELCYLFQNLHPEDPITAVITGGISVYATNTYWQVGNTATNTNPDNGWVWIRDYNNIPAACRSARYWIVNLNTEDLKFKRGLEPFQLYVKGTNANGCSKTPIDIVTTGMEISKDNYANGCYLRGSNLYIPASGVRRSVSVGTVDAIMSYGNWIVVLHATCNSVSCIDVSDVQTSSPVTNVPLTWDNSDPANNVYKTETGTGYIVLQSNGASGQCYILNVKGATPSATVHSWKHACAIWGTNYVAYTQANNENTIYIYDCSTGANVGSAIQSPVATISMMVGHSNFLWIAGTSAMYVADLRVAARPTTACTNTIGSGILNNQNDVRSTAIDDCMIVYNSKSQYNMSHTMYFNMNTPAGAAPLSSDFNGGSVSSNIGSPVEYRLVVAQAATISGSAKRSIALVTSCNYANGSSNPNGSDNRVFDFGQYMANGTVALSQKYSYGYRYTNWVVYGTNIVHESTYITPIINYMPIKLEGTTDVPTAINNMKRITNKQWQISYSNAPLWGDEISGSGIPPGTPVARTDISGEITGWS